MILKEEILYGLFPYFKKKRRKKTYKIRLRQKMLCFQKLRASNPRGMKNHFNILSESCFIYLFIYFGIFIFRVTWVTDIVFKEESLKKKILLNVEILFPSIKKIAYKIPTKGTFAKIKIFRLSEIECDPFRVST